MSLNLSNTTRFTMALMLITPLGCKARELGSNYADTQAQTVDDTWVSAVKACWPSVAHQGNSMEGVKHYLADPIHFRAAFAVYAPFTDSTLRSVVAAPVSSAPLPDVSVLAHSQSPILTRVQAVANVTDNATRVPSTDSLCNIQPGLPVGFR